MKLVTPEPESAALEAELARFAGAVASELLEVEATRVGERLGGTTPAMVAEGLRHVTLIPISPQIRRRAGRLRPPELRTLDAIHLATALAVGSELEALFAYDQRLVRAAADSGLRVSSPGS